MSAAGEDAVQRIINAQRAERRRRLYRSDPLWRLTKLKANRETKLRAKMRGDARCHP